jgi:hypothetical protein
MWDWFLYHSKQLSELAQALALVAAAGFFGWKLFTGYQVCNLSLQLSLARISKYSGRDRLITNIKLSKGDRASLLLKRVHVVVKVDGSVVSDEVLTSPQVPDKTRMIRLTPGESTQFSHICEIGTDDVCNVEISVDGKSSWFTTGHWKASAHSVPLSLNAELMASRAL